MGGLGGRIHAIASYTNSQRCCSGERSRGSSGIVRIAGKRQARLRNTCTHSVLILECSGAGYSRYVSRSSTNDRFSTNSRAGGHRHQLQ